METDNELNELLDSIIDMKTIMMGNSGVVSTIGSNSTSSITTTYLPYGTTSYGYMYHNHNSIPSIEDIEEVTKYKRIKDQPQTMIDKIDVLLDSMLETENEDMQKASKHLTFAKAYLEKMVLDKLNQKL